MGLRMSTRALSMGAISAGAVLQGQSRPSRALPTAVVAAPVDVVIVGGGIAGVSVALQAARRGASVVLLERATLASESSGLSAGTVWSAGWPSKHTPGAATVGSFLCAGSAAIYGML